MRKFALLASTVLATIVGVSAASADPITFQWNPSGATTPLSGQTTFSADNMIVADYARILIDPSNLNNIQETAILPVIQFRTGTTAVSTPGFTLYFYVTATSFLNGLPGTSVASVTGAFTSLTYTLYGATGSCSFDSTIAAGPSASCVNPTEILATGSLDAPQGVNNNVSIDFGLPAAHAEVNSVAGAGAGTFFVSPVIGSFDFSTAFTNDPNVVTQGTFNGNPAIAIKGGGGNITLVPTLIPEPVTLSVFGAGLAGAAALRRRKAKKA